MAFLGNLLGLGISRHRSSGMWNRGYGRGRGHSSWGYGRTRTHAPGFFGGSMGRMAMGSLAFWLARGFFNRRSIHH